MDLDREKARALGEHVGMSRAGTITRLLIEFGERPGAGRIVHNPFIHATVGGAFVTAALGFNQYAEGGGVALGARFVAVAAMVAVVAILVGIQWRNPVVGRGIETVGQLLLAAVWVGNNVVLYYLPPGPVDTGWSLYMIPATLYALASLARVIDLYLTTEHEKAFLGLPPNLHLGAHDGAD